MPRQAAAFTGRRFYHEIGRVMIAWALRLFFSLYGRWEVRGLEHIPRAGGFVVAGNHVSYLDPLVGWAAVYGTRWLWGVGRDDLWNHGLVAFLLDCIGVIPIKRGSADRAMIRRALELVAKGDGVGLFPEGTRSADGKLQPAQAGVGMLVLKSGAPVIPAAFLGTYEMLPRHRNRLKRAKLIVAFGSPLTFSPDTSREAVTDAVMRAIAALMTENGFPTEPPLPARSVSEEKASEA
jgi:1-acyl-sn-glycerol-3-phosphate acyltransferase